MVGGNSLCVDRQGALVERDRFGGTVDDELWRKGHTPQQGRLRQPLQTFTLIRLVGCTPQGRDRARVGRIPLRQNGFDCRR